MITLYFVRHGQTVWNESGRYQGSTEVALSALGKEMEDALCSLQFVKTRKMTGSYYLNI